MLSLIKRCADALCRAPQNLRAFYNGLSNNGRGILIASGVMAAIETAIAPVANVKNLWMLAAFGTASAITVLGPLIARDISRRDREFRPVRVCDYSELTLGG
jgi:type IV secretory pathway TrbD component